MNELYLLLARRPEVAICEPVSGAVAHSLLSQGCTSRRLQSGSHLHGPLQAHLKRKQEPEETLTSERGKRVRGPQQVMSLESLGDNPRVGDPGKSHVSLFTTALLPPFFSPEKHSPRGHFRVVHCDCRLKLKFSADF